MSLRRQPAVGPTGATGATGPAGTVPAGTPVLRGPYVVNYTDIPHDGDTLTLWTPQVGDVLLRLFVDVQTVTQWDHGTLFLGQGVNGVADSNVLCQAAAGGISQAYGASLDLLDAIGNNTSYTDASSVGGFISAYVFHSTMPVQIQLGPPDALDPTQGHCALYALVAQAVAP